MPKTILIADDNDDLREILSLQLKSRGYQVLEACNGDEAVEKCKSQRPDLVLLDVLMPGKDGAEASAELKADPATQGIPVIFLTSLVRDEKEGANADTPDRITLPKSSSADDVIRKIEQVLKK
jgi:CheY-like chemotaxis protein